MAQTDPPPGLPRVVKICDAVLQYRACADWKWNGTDFSYDYGKISGTGTIRRMGNTAVRLYRKDTHASFPLRKGEAQYEGIFNTDSGGGKSTYITDGRPLDGTWTAMFEPIKSVEVPMIEPILPPPPPPGTPALEVPVGFEECEGDCINSEKKNLGVWHFRGMKGEANWSQGNKAKLIVDRYDVNGVVIRREDLTTSSTASQTAVYTGRLSDGRIDGIETLKWIGRDSEPKVKQIRWYATIAATNCEEDFSVVRARQVGATAVVFDQMPSAFRCFLIAAKEGNREARTLVGQMYRDGAEGVQQDYREAAKWLTLAAIQGDYFSQLDMMQMCELGLGMSAPDPKQALVWKHMAETNPDHLRHVELVAYQRDMNELMMRGVFHVLGAFAQGLGSSF